MHQEKFWALVQVKAGHFHKTRDNLSQYNHKKNIATGETSQDISPFHFFDKFYFHH